MAMSRSVLAISVLCLVCTAFAAPAPEPFHSRWSNPVDSDKDCKIRRGSGALIIELPGTDHDYDPARGRFNAPRLFCELEGNLDLQVRVRIDYRSSAQSTVKGQPSLVSAGFLLIYPETSHRVCDRMEYAVSQQGSRIDTYAIAPSLAEPRKRIAAPHGIEGDHFAIMKTWICKQQQSDTKWDRGSQKQFINDIWDRGWRKWPLLEKVDYAYLRLEQRDGWYNFFISPDGEKWTWLNAQPSLPANTKIGLAAYSTSSEPSKVRFDQLRLTRGKRNKR
jgi:hypothetical protein